MSRKNRRNYYRVLHVQPDAPAEVIKSSYRTLMRTLKTHPDLGGDEWDATLVNEAYAVLSDPESRERYDRERGGPPRGSVPGPDRKSSRAELPVSGELTILSPQEVHVCAFCQTKSHGRFQGGGEECSGCGAPLRLLARTEGISTQRETERIEHRTAMRYRTDPSSPDATTGRVVDLSPTGLRFLSPLQLTVGSVIKIDGTSLSAVATVTRSVPDSETGFFSTGVRFLTLRLGRPRGTFVSECA